ncbi:uncharacterized protein N7469_011385 [Penicillium citrinum]|uniref:Uncharacterized protein n=1 Tax=Penicillium citrinum TaxID=5077 RepID=A0A9W9TDR2_PENCI|nr:uncharacterized protein N7469_011385 [Penicillium citrinum]KAJ5217760.1 hypothetical protein N7469_011385 [Penicillium citrinum]KAK5796594.1 hypothetical protein VI817_005879 [Penicillium citrinum]
MLDSNTDKEFSEPFIPHPESDDGSYIPNPAITKRKGKSRLQICLFILLGILIASLIWCVGIIAILSRTRNITSQDLSNPTPPSVQTEKQLQTSPTHILHCGDNPTEAKAMGCKFQIHSYAWVPEPCFDPVLQEEWLKIRDWEYYTDKYNQGEQVNISVALTGERRLYSTWGQHIEHCAFTWRKYVRTQTGSGVLLTNRDLSYEHAHHCSDALRTKFEHPWDEVNTKVTVEFHMC